MKGDAAMTIGGSMAYTRTKPAKPKYIGSKILKFLTILAAGITFAVLLFLIAYILVKGVPYLNKDLFSFTYTSDNVSLVPALINTFIMTIVSLAIAAPLGIFAAIYLVEYAKKRKPPCECDPYYGRNTFRYSIHCIWSVWYAVFCNSIEVENVPACRCIYDGDHDPSTDHAYIRGSIKISS